MKNNTIENYSQTIYLFSFLSVLLISLTSHGQNDGNWLIHQLDFSLKETNLFVDEPTISAATYHMNTESTLNVSIYDRMLFVVEGEGIARVKTKSLKLKTGDVVFLKANDILTFSANFKMMIWTSKSTKTKHKNKTEKYTKVQIEKKRDSSDNVYNSFIETATMVAGLYMLPKSLNGDGTLVHDFDEINYVVHGTAKFKMNDTIIDVKPGSVMWVKRGIGHSFYDLSDDFDVFILFETINMNHDH